MQPFFAKNINCCLWVYEGVPCNCHSEGGSADRRIFSRRETLIHQRYLVVLRAKILRRASALLRMTARGGRPVNNRSPLKTLLAANLRRIFRHISQIFLRVAPLRVRKIVSFDEKFPLSSLANRVFRGSQQFIYLNQLYFFSFPVERLGYFELPRQGIWLWPHTPPRTYGASAGRQDGCGWQRRGDPRGKAPR